MAGFVFKEAVLPGELVESEVPWFGDVPDVGRVVPEMGVVPRLVFGGEDDADRLLVPRWWQVDDLAGLAPLWAGEACGKIFLAAGARPPVPDGSSDGSNDGGAVVAAFGVDGGPQVWGGGVPQFPFHVVPMEGRLAVLKNAEGLWRRLDWAPLGVFDVFHGRELGDAFRRYTLWCVVVGCYVVLYSTAADKGDVLMQDGAAARWPFSHWLRAGRGVLGAPEDVVFPKGGEGYMGGADLHMPAGFLRLSPLPWQFAGEELALPGDVAGAGGGVLEGQFYAGNAVSVAPRYLAGFDNSLVFRAFDEAYLAAGGMSGGYGKVDKGVARELSVGLVQGYATEHYSVDPLLHEGLGRVFPDGAEEGTLWWTHPNRFVVAFSLHLDAGAGTVWPHWVAVCLAAAPSGCVLSASCCVCYNYWD